jgi:hypothetical protein
MLQTRSTCDNLRQADLLNRLSFGARKSFVLQPVATTSNPSQSSDYNNYDIVQGQTPSNSSACSPLSQYIGSISSSGDFGDGFNYDVDE